MYGTMKIKITCLLLHLVDCLYYLYQWCTVKQISDNQIYLLIKYIKSVLWSVVKRLSYIQDARCLKVKPRERAFKQFKSLVLNVLRYILLLFSVRVMAQEIRRQYLSTWGMGSIPDQVMWYVWYELSGSPYRHGINIRRVALINLPSSCWTIETRSVGSLGE